MILRRPNTRTGTIVPLLALVVVAVFSFVALAVDLGMLNIARTHAQSAADTAALTGTRQLSNKPGVVNNDLTQAQLDANNAVLASPYFTSTIVDDGTTKNKITVTPGLYDYDTTQQQFVFKSTRTGADANKSWTAMRVTIAQTQGTYFSGILGVNSLDTQVTALAVHRPRDTAFVLDFTGSMRFGCTYNWGNTSDGGMLNPDPWYPQFAHYQRYLAYSSDPTKGTKASTPATRSNPLQSLSSFIMASGEVNAPNNYTIDTPGGPPCVKDFWYDPSNVSTPTTSVATVTPANLLMAFQRWNPTLTVAGNSSTYTAGTYSYTGYNAMDTTNTNGPTPAPANFMDQSDSPITYVGDKWPRKKGQVFATSTSWDPTLTTGAARNLAEYLGWLGASYPNGYTTATTPTVNPPSRSSMTPNTAYSTSPNWSNFRDNMWETYGYDMDVADYIKYRGTTYDPRGTLPTNTTGGENGQVKVTSGKFLGYTMGPGYWGKTFFVWPPDPRASKDWRLKFFFNNAGGAFTPSNTTVNSSLLRNGTGQTLNATSGNWKINYPAVLAWIKSGPQVLPPNLRSGRVVYYTSIPNDVTTSGSTAVDLDKVFWKNYIDFVIGANWTNPDQLAGHEYMGWPEGTTPSIAATAAYTSGATTDPRPYMNYMDNPSRPRMHFWFGPQSMMAFLADPVANWWSGMTHEAQCWQLKAAITSVLDDVKNNNPNDYAGLCFFAHNAAYFKTIRSPMSQDFTTAKNVLFYPFNLVPSIPTNSTIEIRPFNTSFNNSTDSSTGLSNVNANLPVANGGTDPNSGFAMAYNLLSPATGLGTDPAGWTIAATQRGRRGAAKVVVFETDGVPNAHQSWTFNKYGYNSYYSNSGTGASDGNGSVNAMNPAYAVIDQIVKPVATSNTAGVDSGFSLPNTPARVYTIGFGDLFSTPSATFQPNARAFLLNCQQHGGTSASTDTALPTDQIISGDYQTRIDNLRSVLQRIMQSGIQVSLIE